MFFVVGCQYNFSKKHCWLRSKHLGSGATKMVGASIVFQRVVAADSYIILFSLLYEIYYICYNLYLSLMISAPIFRNRRTLLEILDPHKSSSFQI